MSDDELKKAERIREMLKTVRRHLMDGGPKIYSMNDALHIYGGISKHPSAFVQVGYARPTGRKFGRKKEWEWTGPERIHDVHVIAFWDAHTAVVREAQRKTRENKRRREAEQLARKQTKLEIDPKPVKLEGDAAMEVKAHQMPSGFTPTPEMPFRVTTDDGLHLDCGGIKIPLPCFVSGKIGDVWVSLKINKAYTKKNK